MKLKSGRHVLEIVIPLKGAITEDQLIDPAIALLQLLGSIPVMKKNGV
jgi:hypothetical protein